MLAAVAAMVLAPSPWEREIVYQIFPRSFRDSNGDRHGDLKGITHSLDHLKELGVTTILLNPIAASPNYHNYFADDFLRIDPEFGTDADLRTLCRQAHQRGLKVLLDMEPQYVTDRHRWIREGRRDYVWTTGSWLWDIDLPWYDGAKVRVAAINPSHPHVRRHVTDAFLKWARLGVDGYRIDHMMDDLDNKRVKTDLLAGFWRPLVSEVKRKYPGTFFVAEQADWGYGEAEMRRGGADAAYAIPLGVAIQTMDPAKIRAAIAGTAKATPVGKTQLLFAENHDLDRIASLGNPGQARLAMALTFALKGTPMLYYGQELGMRGKKGPGSTDGTDIPRRLAYEWSRRREAKGMAIWYRDTGPWWNNLYMKDGDGISVEEQRNGPDFSMWKFTKLLIQRRRNSQALSFGEHRLVETSNPNLIVVERFTPSESVTFVANFSGEFQTLPTKEGTTRFGPWSCRFL